MQFKGGFHIHKENNGSILVELYFSFERNPIFTDSHKLPYDQVLNAVKPVT